MKTIFRLLIVIVLTVGLFSACRSQLAVKTNQKETPKNVILLIGDGMGYAQVHAAMLKSPQPLNMIKANYTGSITTHSKNSLITDSGAGGTALATGHKTRNGMIGMSADSVAVPSLIDVFAAAGKSTGLVVSCAVTHATPASFVAKDVSRQNYEAIATDFIDSPVDVVIGGGLNNFDQRADKRMLTKEMQNKGFNYFTELPGDASTYKKLLVLTDTMHPVSKLKGRGNLLPDGTALALQSLSKNPKGFFLMVEGSQIDWAGHANDSAYLITEMFDFDRAVGIAMQFADNNPGTLVIVTADHETGGLTLINKEKAKKLGFSFSSDDHSGILVPVFAYGTGAINFSGLYDNTDIFKRIVKTAGVASNK